MYKSSSTYFVLIDIYVLWVVICIVESCGNYKRQTINECVDSSGNRHLLENTTEITQANCDFSECDCSTWMADNNIEKLPPTNKCRCRPSKTKYITALERNTRSAVQCMIVSACSCEPLSD